MDFLIFLYFVLNACFELKKSTFSAKNSLIGSSINDSNSQNVSKSTQITKGTSMGHIRVHFRVDTLCQNGRKWGNFRMQNHSV